MKENITRSQLTTIIMLMGVTYVVQSATAVAGDMSVVKYIVYPIQDVVYVLIYILIFINMRRNLVFLREWRRMDEIRNNIDLRISVVKKIRLLVYAEWKVRFTRPIVQEHRRNLDQLLEQSRGLERINSDFLRY